MTAYSSGSGDTKHPTILIVEDDPAALETFERILTVNGYEVRVAADAESGLHEMETEPPNAVLVDLHLPMADGVEFLRQVRGGSMQPHLPVAVVTGDYFVDEETVRELRGFGARMYFKPLWEEDLLRLVHDLLGR